MKYEVICISEYTTDDMPRRAILQFATDASRKFNAFLFSFKAENEEENIIVAIVATENFHNVSDIKPALLKEVKNAHLSTWQIGTYVELYL